MHETGHQAAALLGLVESLRPDIQRARRGLAGPERIAWQLWERWISEIVADLYAIARAGVASTMGLIGLVSLPRAFVFRMAPDDPHPFAWIRVHVSCAFGDALYPDPQWRQLAQVWTSMYPMDRLPAGRVRVIRALLDSMPAFLRLVLGHRPASLRGRTVGDVLRSEDRSPDRLVRRYRAWTANPAAIRRTRPALAFAVVGQARARGLLTPEGEDRLLGRLISYWALQSTLQSNAILAAGLPAAPYVPGPVRIARRHRARSLAGRRVLSPGKAGPPKTGMRKAGPRTRPSRVREYRL